MSYKLEIKIRLQAVASYKVYSSYKKSLLFRLLLLVERRSQIEYFLKPKIMYFQYLRDQITIVRYSMQEIKYRC